MYRMGKEEVEAIERVIESRHLFRIDSLLNEVEQFEKEWGDTIGSSYCLAVSGGTPALISSLVGMKVGPGDEVIVPAYTFMATAIAVLAVGAIPVLAEIDESLTIDPVDIQNKISKYTKAIIPVHLNGFPCNMDAICEIAEKHGLLVLEDACQSDGGSYKTKKLGSIGDAGVFSFNHYKILTSGEGGALVTDNQEIYERALIYHDGGSAFRSYVKDLTIPVFAGSQYRISELTGAILRVQNNRLNGILEDLRKNKKVIMDNLIKKTSLRFISSNDIDGDCGTTIGLKFDLESTARKFCAGLGELGWLPIDSGKHVYENWTPILTKNGGHNDYYNPYKMEKNQELNMDITKDSCIKTLEILSRTVFIDVNPDWTEVELEEIAASCKRIAEQI